MDLLSIVFSAMACPALALSPIALSAIELDGICGFAMAVSEDGAGGSAGGSGIRLGAEEAIDFGGGAGVNDRIGGGDGAGAGLAVARPADSGLAIAVSAFGFAG